MKKLLLLLILSFFSAQSFAGSCPDGSEPVKSVSADGTYFVFNCGGSAASSSETSKKTESSVKVNPTELEMTSKFVGEFNLKKLSENSNLNLGMFTTNTFKFDVNQDGYDDLIVGLTAMNTDAVNEPNEASKPVILFWDNNIEEYVVDIEVQKALPFLYFPRRIHGSINAKTGLTHLFIGDTGLDLAGNDFSKGLASLPPNCGAQNHLITYDPTSKKVAEVKLPKLWDYTHGLAAADLNGDQIADYVVLNSPYIKYPQKCSFKGAKYTNESYILYSNKNGGFDKVNIELNYKGYSKAPTITSGIAIVDENKDTFLLLGSEGSGSGIYAFKQDSKASFTETSRVNAPSIMSESGKPGAYSEVLYADINADGTKEVVASVNTTNWTGRYIQLLDFSNGQLRDRSEDVVQSNPALKDENDWCIHLFFNEKTAWNQPILTCTGDSQLDKTRGYSYTWKENKLQPAKIKAMDLEKWVRNFLPITFDKKTVYVASELKGENHVARKVNGHSFYDVKRFNLIEPPKKRLAPSNNSKGIDRFGGTSEIPESANPNDETLKYYLYRYLYSFNKYPFCSTDNKELHCEDIPPKYTHSIEPSNNPYQFNSDLREDEYIKKQMQDTALLSYLLYEDGKIVIDEKTPEDRFGDMFRNSSKFHSQSVAKTLIGYVAGHAICKGYIESVDSRLNDWPALENTLYHNQKLIDVLNMAAGTQEYFDGSNRFSNSNRTVTSPIVENIMKRELKGSKKSNSTYNYVNLNPNLVGSYLIYKLGNDNFQLLLDDVFQKKARIGGDAFFIRNERAKENDISIMSNFFATRYDYLRVAKAMLDDWENDNCVGQYLKTIHERRIPKNGAQGYEGRVGLPLSYGGFFHTGYIGMENRPVMGMDGYGGQTILIDFERGRIIATQAIHDNMKFPQPGGFDFKKISYERIKNGKPSSKAKSPPEPVIESQQVIKERNAAIETERNAKQYWDDYYDCKETTDGKSNIAACIDKNIKKREKSNLETSTVQNIAKALSEESELFKGIKTSNTFDGYYGFTNMMPPTTSLGNGTLEINNGIVTISQGSGDLTPKYESFEGRIDQNGDIKANFYFAPCRSCGLEDKLIVFEGNINKKKISGKYNDSQIYFYLTGKKGDITKVETSNSDPTVSKIIEVTHGDKLIVDIAEPHELAGSNIKIGLKDIDTPDATKSCPKQMELGIKVRDFVAQKLNNASSIKLTNFSKTNTKIIAQVIVDGVDLGEELVSKGYASEEYGFWKPYFCSALNATNEADQYYRSNDEAKSIFWYERSIVLDPDGSKNQESHFLLSKMYSNLGNTDKSLENLKKSASIGWLPAMEQLGFDYLNGNVVKKDSNQGKSWLKKAFDKGSSVAEGIYCGSLSKEKQKTCKF